MEDRDRLRYAVVIFYSIFALLISSIELVIILLPFLVFTESKLSLKWRVFLSSLVFLLMASALMMFLSVTLTIYAIYTMVILFLIFMAFDEVFKWKRFDPLFVGIFLILEFLLITGILHILIVGVVW